jgi:hypothetical protein
MTKITIERPKITLLTCFTALLVIVILAVILVFSIQLSFPAVNKPPVQTQQPFTVIPAPSVTIPVILPTVTIAPNVTVVPTPVPSGEMGIGAYVQISGTGGDGLRLRAGPGTANPPLFLGMESEVFQVRDGPKESDGFTWWYLVAPYDENRNGWAVQNYLSVITDKPTQQP